ncbi:MAG: hypothetical protein EA379_06170 [Phycisphaerales bacterium]|nr:MAG: hypothetical protein EA379_06170 [Phycisphaerales bacterium]
MRILTASLLAAAVAGSASANITQVVPPAYDGAQGTASFVGPMAIGARTYQLLISETQLTNLVGLELTGISWRLPANATIGWPASNLSYNNYDIYLSDSVDPSDRSLTFADNIVGTQTQVRSGALSVDAGDYTFGSSPNAFGPTIFFNTGYLYTGGNLLLELRHDGNGVASRAMDAIGTSTAGYGTDFSAAWQSGYDAVSGFQGNFAIVEFTAIPAPGAAALLGLGALVATRRRR